MDTKSMHNPETSDYLANVFESSPFALISFDPHLRIMMFNRAAQELTGLSCAEVVGCRATRIIEFERLHNIIDALRKKPQATADGYITKLRAADGSEIPVVVRISILLDNRNKLLGVLIVATDLREIQKLQAKLLEAERLAAITETAISINHEINNPLCSILGNTQLILMEKERLEPGMVKKLKSIETEIIRIQRVSERLARITRPVLKEYVDGRRMLDVEGSSVDEDR
ncbi:MAG: PAS domain S-box protein [bacterium]|nr:MAG: PAS domain S-box protein [bacterium]